MPGFRSKIQMGRFENHGMIYGHLWLGRRSRL